VARRYRRREPGFAPEGGESPVDFSSRCVDAVARLAAPHRGQAIALVCHGGLFDSMNRAVSRIALGAPRTWLLGNAAINRLLHTPAGFMPVGWNDCRHLQSLCDAHPGADHR
jgi:probable phosphoglycerate mutase